MKLSGPDRDPAALQLPEIDVVVVVPIESPRTEVGAPTRVHAHELKRETPGGDLEVNLPNREFSSEEIDRIDCSGRISIFRLRAKGVRLIGKRISSPRSLQQAR